MKKLTHLIFIILLFSCSLNYVSAAEMRLEKDPVGSLTPQQQVRLQLITKRVMEIKTMDKSGLSRNDRKSLRIELRQLKKEARGIAAGGVFLTVGALLVVIILLILLL